MKRLPLALAVWILIVAQGPLSAVADDRAAVAPVELRQIISREDPNFDCAGASLTVGRDGMVYLSSAGQDTGYILRVSRDGSDKLGGAAVAAVHNATANAAGLIAGSHGHFSHLVALYDARLNKVGEMADFLVSDQAGRDAPASVEVGAGGDRSLGLGLGTSLQRPEKQALSIRPSPLVSFVERHPPVLAPLGPPVEFNRSTTAAPRANIHNL